MNGQREGHRISHRETQLLLTCHSVADRFQEQMEVFAARAVHHGNVFLGVQSRVKWNRSQNSKESGFALLTDEGES